MSSIGRQFKEMAVLWRSPFLVILALSITLSSCAPQPAIPSTLSVPSPSKTPQPTSTQPEIITTEAAPAEATSSMFKAGFSYPDLPNDMAISFLDVVDFQATVDERSETSQSRSTHA